MRSALARVVLLELALAASEQTSVAAAGEGPRAGERFDALILEHSQRARLNPRFVKSIIAVESEFSPRAVSPRGARGLMQVMPATAEEMGVRAADLGEAGANLRAGTAYLDRLFQAARAAHSLPAARLHDSPAWVQRRVLAAYHAGPRMLWRPPERWPSQTRAYVRKVMRLCGS